MNVEKEVLEDKPGDKRPWRPFSVSSFSVGLNKLGQCMYGFFFFLRA